MTTKPYHLFRHWAAGMEEAHRTGSPLARPLWWHWPADPLAHGASGQWLLGEGVLVSPVLEKGADQVTFAGCRLRDSGFEACFRTQHSMATRRLACVGV